jgi:glyoxylase-like metal-dependent hydrolase (beta-lactamase superfamily II)
MRTDARFEPLTEHADRFTPDDRTDRPALGAVHGASATVIVEGGASVEHLRSFLFELERHGRPAVTAIALTHWHWDHSFGSAAADVPVIAHRDSAAELAVQSGYDWSDAALDARVAAGRELAFCRDMMRLEIPDRSDLRIVVPSLIVDDLYTMDLGGVTAVIEHVGGDHAPDSCVVYVPEERVIFLGDCLYQRLHAPEPYLTITGVRRLTQRLARFEVDVAVEGHADDVADAAGFTARLAQLRLAADLVETHGADAVAHAGGDGDLVETIGFLLVGEGLPG